MRARARNRKEPLGVDRRLAMLGGDSQQRRIEQVLLVQLCHHCSDRSVDKFVLVEQCTGGPAKGIAVSTRDGWIARGVLDQFLPYAHRLEVHPEQVRHWRRSRPVMG